MRVLFITGEYPPTISGIGDHCHLLAKALQARGHCVGVLTSRLKSGERLPRKILQVGFRFFERWKGGAIPRGR